MHLKLLLTSTTGLQNAPSTRDRVYNTFCHRGSIVLRIMRQAKFAYKKERLNAIGSVLFFEVGCADSSHLDNQPQDR